MIYLDYSATTKANPNVLKYFNYCCDKYFANANALYLAGRKSRNAINRASKYICKLLDLENYEIVYTSSATEANNLAIKGIVESFHGPEKRIITTLFEHSSIIAPINILQKNGVLVDIVRHDKTGKIDLDHLRELINPQVALISIGAVNSELGIRQPIEEIAKIAEANNIPFHCDATQSIGKEIIDFSRVDLLTMSAHKFYGLKGIGLLAKRKDLKITAQIHGGHSTTSLRAGTPSTPLILSLKKALSLAHHNLARKNMKVKLLNMYLRAKLEAIPGVVINSPEKALPHILNFSFLGFSSSKMVNYFSKQEIYISNYSACASNLRKSYAVLTLTNNEKRATSSLRVSLSYLTTKYEIRQFISALKKMRKVL